MSYFDAVYADHELSPLAKTICMYLHDRTNREGESWYAINTIASDLGLSRSTVKRTFGNLVRQGPVEKKRGTGKTESGHPTSIDCYEKEHDLPPRGDCAFLLDREAGHDGPPRRENIGCGYIQR